MTNQVARCRESIARHSKSFDLASRLLPSGARDDAAIVYAWCRRGDDSIDLCPPAEQGRAIRRLRSELRSIYAGERQSDPVLAAFQECAARRQIPKEYASELIAGFEMDASGASYETTADLLLYCFRAAGTVGLMMCHVLGCTNRRALRHAAHLGMAMQLTNICRDIDEDWKRGRRYVPADLLPPSSPPRPTFGQPPPQELRPALSAAARSMLGLAEPLYRSGDRGLVYLSWRAALAVRTARLVYAAIGSRLIRVGCDVLSGRAFVPRRDKLRLAVWALVVNVLCAVAFLRPFRKARLRPAVRYPHDILPV